MPEAKPKLESVRAIAELCTIAIPILAGVVIAYVVLSVFIIPRIGFPGDLSRIVKLEERLDSSPVDSNRVVLVSNSVGVEGLEATSVQQELDSGFAVENQAVNSLDLLSGRLYIGRVLESNPQILVWILRPETIGRIVPINPEVASAMRFANFHNQADWLNEQSIPGLSPEARSRLDATDFQTLVSLRSIPLRHLNDQVRVRTRKGVLPPKPLELNAPYQINQDIAGQKLQRHLDQIAFNLDERTKDDNIDGIAFIQSTIQQILQTSTTPILVIAPTNPLADEAFSNAEVAFAQAMNEISQSTGVVVIDLTKTLSSDEFADAIHPNRGGARKFSAILGQALRSHFDQTAREQN